ncbi:endonuclease/exonuclease/phosphatase family protein [Nocardioides sp.]|uniref:endonuclease/exonuclease/phosphatase family protein n=1 Tax=Nocardioides sp. TaxID=35761 RepID=UPI003D13F78F
MNAAALPVAKEQVGVRIGSYNILCTVGVGTFRSAVEELTTRVEVAGLQEVNSKDKEAVLASLSSRGWNYFRSKVTNAVQNPVIWDTNRFRFLDGRAVKLNDGTYIGKEMPKHYVKSMFATVVHLQDLQSGQKISIVNVHLVPGATTKGRPTPGRPRLYRVFRTQVHNVAVLTKTERAWGRTFVMGDFNIGWVADERERLPRMPFMSFKRQTMPSMWATDRPTTKRGTHQQSLIDQVWSTTRATSSTVAFDMKFSDHHPAIAGYQLDVVS